MEDKLNIHQVLNVFEKLRLHGIKRGDEYHLKGLTAVSDFDGYTIVIYDDYVTLRIYFHNKYDLIYSHSKHLDLFMERIQQINNMG